MKSMLLQKAGMFMHELILTSPLTLKSADAPPPYVLAGRAFNTADEWSRRMPGNAQECQANSFVLA